MTTPAKPTATDPQPKFQIVDSTGKPVKARTCFIPELGMTFEGPLFQSIYPDDNLVFNTTKDLLVYTSKEQKRRKLGKKQCPMCGTTSSCTQNLVLHVRTHTDERPYVCPYSRIPDDHNQTCNYASKTKAGLLSHLKLMHCGEHAHTIWKPFILLDTDKPSSKYGTKMEKTIWREHYQRIYDAVRLAQSQSMNLGDVEGMEQLTVGAGYEPGYEPVRGSVMSPKQEEMKLYNSRLIQPLQPLPAHLLAPIPPPPLMPAEILPQLQPTDEPQVKSEPGADA